MNFLRPFLLSSFALACFITAAPVHAKTKIVTRTVTVIGDRSCVNWTKAYRQSQGTNPGIGDSVDYAFGRAWLAGYISGAAIASPQPNILHDLDLPTVIDWTNRFCVDHEKSNLSDAVDALFKKLGRYPY